MNNFCYLLIDSSDAPDIQSAIPDKHRELFEMANRGGLSSPYTFAVATLGAKFYRAMMNGPPTLMEEFHKRKNHQQVFVDSVHETVRSNDMLQCLLSTRCNQLHCNFKLILNIIFNCFAKNELKRMNTQSIANEPVPKSHSCLSKINFKRQYLLFKKLLITCFDMAKNFKLKTQPLLKLGTAKIRFVDKIKYLCVFLHSHFRDDDNIYRLGMVTTIDIMLFICHC